MVHGDGAEIIVEGGLVEMNGISSSGHPGRIDVGTGQLLDTVGTLRRRLESRRKRKEAWKEGDNPGKKDEGWSVDVREV